MSLSLCPHASVLLFIFQFIFLHCPELFYRLVQNSVDVVLQMDNVLLVFQDCILLSWKVDSSSQSLCKSFARQWVLGCALVSAFWVWVEINVPNNYYNYTFMIIIILCYTFCTENEI